MFVLGIDPGLSRCGYCCIEASGSRQRAIALGVITTPTDMPLARRLSLLQSEVRDLIDEHPPSVLAIERVLFQNNVRTAMAVGQASGVVMAEAAHRGVEVFEYSPNEVKAAVAGYGSADKAQVTQMVQTLLRLERTTPSGRRGRRGGHRALPPRPLARVDGRPTAIGVTP